MPKGKGPKPYRQSRVSTTFLRVPKDDWAAVKRGHKSEFRSSIGRDVQQVWGVEPPLPVVAYTFSRGRGHEAALMVLEATWREPLGAISAESLEREGYSSFAEFRRYYMERERRHFAPTREIQVFRVRQWSPDDFSEMAETILRRLYGDFLPSPGGPGSSPASRSPATAIGT